MFVVDIILVKSITHDPPNLVVLSMLNTTICMSDYLGSNEPCL
jgi:hypothetical protein